MNRHLHSPTKLTEFARDFDDEPETIFTKFVNKITNVYNTSYNSVNDLPVSGNLSTSSSQGNLIYENVPGIASSGIMIDRSSSSNSLNSKLNDTSSATSNGDPNDNNDTISDIPSYNSEGRTLNVLRRISNIVASRNKNLINYKDTQLQSLWMPDSKAKECYDCCQKFTTFRRKHHCRLCGQIFCSKCCNQVVPGKIIKCSGDLKVCTYCSQIVLNHLKSPDINVDLQDDLQALQENLANKFQQTNTTADEEPNKNLLRDQSTRTGHSNSAQRKISVGYQEERLVSHQQTHLSNADRKHILQQSNSLKTLHEKMSRELPLQNCGTDLVNFLIINQKSSNKIQSIAILNAMLEAGFLMPLVPDSEEENEFNENLHYKLLQRYHVTSENKSIASEIPIIKTMKSENSDFQLSKSLDESLSFQSIQSIELERSIRSTTTTAKTLLQSYCDHEDLLLHQMLRSFNLDESWSKILIEHCARAANQFRSEFITNDLMDIRNYINFKKVPGGSRSECTLKNGVVFSKNVAHKDMATHIQNARVLLLQCPIVFERVEGKFVSIETLMLQEKQYLQNVITRILSFKPNVIMVHKNVSGVAQEMLRSNGLTLVLDVKLSVMERLARCLQCDIVTSIESKFRPAKLGNCDAFYIKNYPDGNGFTKTLMFFEMDRSVKGSCCILRGGDNSELAKVKQVAQMLLYARYNRRLEMSFLLDEFARPPSPKPLIFDSKEHTPSDDEEAKVADQKNKIEQNSQVQEDLRSCKISGKSLTERKSEDKLFATTSAIENVNDFSDPLRAPQNELSEKSNEVQLLELPVQTPNDNRFRTALSSNVLSISPFVSFPLPYLETEPGRKCLLRSLFQKELYYSKQWSSADKQHSASKLENLQRNYDLKLNPTHSFLTKQITKPFDDEETQALLAEFRAFGNKYPKCTTMSLIKKDESGKPKKILEESNVKDALDLKNHQRIPVLFSSFYYNGDATSSFCAQPTLLDMKFYGQHDIMLAQFLQRYCFKSSCICQLCNLPMTGHIRRYVHSLGCVQVTLSEDLNKNDTDKIYLTSVCTKCQNFTSSVPISEDTQCLSFAKYLELRFHAHSYKARNIEENKTDVAHSNTCEHSLHREYIQYFSYKGVLAKFVYTPIQVWEIQLPVLIICLKTPKSLNGMKVLEDIKEFSEKGYEVYTKIQEKIDDSVVTEESKSNLKILLNDDQIIFRRHIETVQTLLTEKLVHSYDINDAMLNAKRSLAESIETWGMRLHDAAAHAKTNQHQLVQQQSRQNDSVSTIDSGTVCTEDLKSSDLDVFSTDNEKDSSNDIVNTINTESSGMSSCSTTNISKPDLANEDIINLSTNKSNKDKKTIKKMFSQLLPSTGHANLLPSPLSVNEHLTLPLGAIPILVHDNDFSSIIAYSLTSYEYKKVIESMGTENIALLANNGVTSGTGSPNMKRKSQDGSIDSDEKDSPNPKCDDEKKLKSNHHIELNFQDLSMQFSCKIYFAKEFDELRAITLKPPKLNKTIYKDLEANMKNEELRLAQKHSNPEMEMIRKLSGAKQETQLKHSSSQTNIHKDETRIFFARSLCRSIQWEARGGKSGSKFSKTFDDRFVLKEMSQKEVTIFENFAPNYFEYLKSCSESNEPTLLAKIFGVFRLILKKKDSVQEKFLLVMENLFYECDIKNKFDLKGSERNRLIETTNQNGDIVLWDENLIQMSWSNPLYILSHSKIILKEALLRDASFLERNQVMDYSLLVGLNNKTNTLIFGIIDYIRTFTFDKKVESYIKQSGLLGGQGKLPTVIHPGRYKNRFIEAMDRYFLLVPDRWEGFLNK